MSFTVTNKRCNLIQIITKGLRNVEKNCIKVHLAKHRRATTEYRNPLTHLLPSESKIQEYHLNYHFSNMKGYTSSTDNTRIFFCKCIYIQTKYRYSHQILFLPFNLKMKDNDKCTNLDIIQHDDYSKTPSLCSCSRNVQ